MKKVLFIFLGMMTFAISPMVAGSINTAAANAYSYQIESLRVNGYDISNGKQDTYYGIELSYKTKQFYLEVIPADSSLTVEGNGMLTFTEDEQRYEFSLSKNGIKEVHYLIVVRGEAPTQMDIFKEKAIDIFKAIELPLMVIPVVVAIILIIPTKKRPK